MVYQNQLRFSSENIPRGRTLAPKTPRFSIIFLMDLRSDMSINPRRPSAVPDDCIILCIERRRCFNAELRAIGSSTDRIQHVCIDNGGVRTTKSDSGVISLDIKINFMLQVMLVNLGGKRRTKH